MEATDMDEEPNEEQINLIPNSSTSSKRFALKISIQTNFGDDYVFQIVHKEDWTSMAVSLSSNTVKLYSPVTGQFVGEWCRGQHSGSINHILFSGNILHSRSSDGTIRAWDTRSYQQVSCVRAGPSQEVFSFSFGGSGDNLLSAGCKSQEGRIDENRHLQCSYHGWSFDGPGSCSQIPQASSDGPEARAVQSPRACATKFPTMVSHGLLFVWPDENGLERARATKPPMLPADFENPEYSTVTIQRDLFYGYDTLMENVSDPSHIDFTHHKVTGRRDRAKPLPFKMDSSGHWGFSGENEGNPKISAEFIAPCYYINKVEIDTKLPIVGDQKWVIWICSFNVPMAPGKTRSIVCSARNFFQFTMPGSAWWQVVPRWHEHWTSNKVYDGDMIVLQGQEKVFLSKSMDGSTDVNKQYTKLTFTPTQADRFVLAFRNWLRRYGNSQPEWFGHPNTQSLPSTYLSKRQMLDRYEQHTLKCSSCKKAHKTFETLQKVLTGAAVVLCAAAGVPPEIQFRLIFAGLAVLSAGLAYYCHELQKNFVFVDYVHAEIE